MPDPLIVIADDNEYLTELVEHRFAAEGWRVRRAASGPEAVHAVARGGAALVLMDIDMPGGGGLEALASVKRHPRGAKVPVVMLTGRRASADVQAAARLGAAGYVVKPFDVETLVRRVQKHLAPQIDALEV